MRFKLHVVYFLLLLITNAYNATLEIMPPTLWRLITICLKLVCITCLYSVVSVHTLSLSLSLSLSPVSKEWHLYSDFTLEMLFLMKPSLWLFIYFSIHLEGEEFPMLWGFQHLGWRSCVQAQIHHRFMSVYPPSMSWDFYRYHFEELEGGGLLLIFLVVGGFSVPPSLSLSLYGCVCGSHFGAGLCFFSSPFWLFSISLFYC